MQIRSIFVVLSDDAFRKILHQFDKKSRAPKANPTPHEVARSETRPESMASAHSSEDESDPERIETAAVETATASPVTTAHTSKGKGSRSMKRGASSALSGPSAKK